MPSNQPKKQRAKPNCGATSQLCGWACVSKNKNCKSVVSVADTKQLLVSAITQQGYDELTKLFDDFAGVAPKAAAPKAAAPKAAAPKAAAVASVSEMPPDLAAAIVKAVIAKPATVPVKATIAEPVMGPVKAYQVKETLGKGQFGTAVLTNRDTVVKILKPYNKKTMGKDLQDEYEGLLVLSRLGIGPKPLGLDLDKGLLEMEHVKGETIKSKLGSKDMDSATSDKVVKVLAKLHLAGYTHNDSHRGNIMATEDGSLKLIDAGFLAKSDKVNKFNHGLDDLGSADVSASGKNDNRLVSKIYAEVNYDKDYTRIKTAMANHTYAKSGLTEQQVEQKKAEAATEYHALYIKALTKLQQNGQLD